LRAAAGLAALLLGTGAAHAEARAPLAGKLPQPIAAHSAVYVGAPAADTALHVVVSLPLRNEAALDALLRDIYNPASPHFRHYLSVAEYTDRFGPTAADYEAAARFFADRGLKVTATAANRFLLDVDAPVADIERVFHVRMGLYKHPTEARTYFAPDRQPTLDLAVPVLQIIGLDNYVLPHPRLVRPGNHPGHARGATGPDGNFDGNDIRKAYYPTGSMTGSGQVVGLMELQGYEIADVKAFFANGYGPKNHVTVAGISTDGASLGCPPSSCDDSEQALDIEYAISMAPGLRGVEVYVGNNAEDVLNSQATRNTAAQLSTSWGWDEAFATDDGDFKEMAAQGQSNLTASGDYSSLADSGPWPEEDANITGVGGTDLVTKSNGLWESETGWSGSAGGPSLDTTIKIESYQRPYINSVNQGSTTLRNVPDIAALANNFYICADAGCSGGWEGTSFASPIYTGFVALANQEAAAAGKGRVGFLNPEIYKLGHEATYSVTFHDIVKGTSGLYSASKKYDLVTGLGSPYGQALVDALANGS
jgi:subtilase family serine protease